MITGGADYGSDNDASDGSIGSPGIPLTVPVTVPISPKKSLEAWVCYISNAVVLILVACAKQVIALLNRALFMLNTLISFCSLSTRALIRFALMLMEQAATPAVTVSQSDVVSLMQSPSWHLQAIALVLLRLQFAVCLQQAQDTQAQDQTEMPVVAPVDNATRKGLPKRSKSSSKFNSKFGTSGVGSGRGASSGTDVRQRQLSRTVSCPTGPKATEFIAFCRSGHLRLLLWFLLHSSSLLRHLAMKVGSPLVLHPPF